MAEEFCVLMVPELAKVPVTAVSKLEVRSNTLPELTVKFPPIVKLVEAPDVTGVLVFVMVKLLSERPVEEEIVCKALPLNVSELSAEVRVPPALVKFPEIV